MPQKKVRGLIFRIKEVEGLYYLCSKNKGATQLICAFVFAYAKSRFLILRLIMLQFIEIAGFSDILE